MLLISEHQRYFLFTGVTDMRKGFDTLCGLVRSELKLNPMNRSIRPMVVGRKNYLFAGSHGSAERAACYYSSFFITCKLHGTNPKAWIQDVFEKSNTSCHHNITPSSLRTGVSKT